MTKCCVVIENVPVTFDILGFLTDVMVPSREPSEKVEKKTGEYGRAHLEYKCLLWLPLRLGFFVRFHFSLRFFSQSGSSVTRQFL